MKKKLALILALAMSMSLFTACGSDDDDNSKNNKKTSQSASASTEDEEEEETSEEKTTEEETTEEKTTEEETTEEETTEEEVPEEFVPVEGLSETYADLTSRKFAYKGKVYTLGEQTLQDLIDDGVPFNNSDLKHAEDEVNKNYETRRYTAQINSHVSLQCVFFNDTTETKKESECILCEVRYCTIHVPKDSFDESVSKEAKEMITAAGKDLCFAFPLELKKDQLIENSGEGEEKNNEISYLEKSTVYMGSSGYKFTFDKDTDQLQQVYITWLP